MANGSGNGNINGKKRFNLEHSPTDCQWAIYWKYSCNNNLPDLFSLKQTKRYLRFNLVLSKYWDHNSCTDVAFSIKLLFGVALHSSIDRSWFIWFILEWWLTVAASMVLALVRKRKTLLAMCLSFYNNAPIFSSLTSGIESAARKWKHIKCLLENIPCHVVNIICVLYTQYFTIFICLLWGPTHTTNEWAKVRWQQQKPSAHCLQL